MGQKYALIIATAEYQDSGLAALVAPNLDAYDFAGALQAPHIGGFDEVTTLLNEIEANIRRAVARFFAGRKPDDLLLLYFSGHGIRDDQGQLYLAAKDTDRSLLSATALQAEFITDHMNASRSKRQVLILDCCNSGAFAHGTKAPTGGSMGTAAAFEGTGYGRVVLTATDATQFAWEGDQVLGEASNSVFTHFLVKGLETGEADTDGDGQITLDELYDYAYERVVALLPQQTPGKWSFRQQGELIIARNPLPPPGKALPPELQQALASRLAGVRAGAVQELAALLAGDDKRLAVTAEQSLQRLAAQDDSRTVAEAARAALQAQGRSVALPEAVPPAPSAPLVPAPLPPGPAAPPTPTPAPVAKRGALWGRISTPIAAGGVVGLLAGGMFVGWLLFGRNPALPTPTPSVMLPILDPLKTLAAIATLTAEALGANLAATASPTPTRTRVIQGDFLATGMPAAPSPTPTPAPLSTATLAPTPALDQPPSPQSQLPTSPEPTPTATPFGGGTGRLAFHRSNDNVTYGIYVINFDGTGETQLFSNGFSPNWSPNGRQIAFHSARDDANREIYVMAADGSRATRLTFEPEADYEPEWSPDGLRLVFYSQRDGNLELYVMNADGSGLTRLTNDAADDWSPTWSPDGQRIAFVSLRNGFADLYVMNADGTRVTRLTSSAVTDGAPAWSPDGRLIAFHAQVGGSSSTEIFVIQPDGTGLVQLTSNGGFNERPAWSPDGLHLAFHSLRGINYEIVVMDANGDNQRLLTNTAVTNGAPAWEP